MIIISLLWYLVFGYGCLKMMFIHSLIQNAIFLGFKGLIVSTFLHHITSYLSQF